MTNFLIIMLLITPWIFIPNPNILNQFRLPQLFILDITFLGIVALSFLNGNKENYKNKYFFWFIVYVFAQFAIYMLLPFSLAYKTGRVINFSYLEPMIHVLMGLWAIQIILSNFASDDFKRIARALCLSSALISVFSILQFIGFDPLAMVGAKYNCANQISACLDNPNLVGSYLALCLPLFFVLRGPKRWIGIVVILLAIWATKCHFAIFLAAFSLISYSLLKFRSNSKILVVISGCALIIILCVFRFDFLKLSSSMSGRLEIWKIAIEKVKLNPLFGSGLGIWKNLGVSLSQNGAAPTPWLQVHNDWLERLVEYGIIGVVLLLLVVFNTFRNFNFKEENYGYLVMFVTFLILMCGSFPFEASTVGFLGIISWCAMEKINTKI